MFIPIDAIRESEERNYRVSLQVLGDTTTLLEDVNVLYGCLLDLAGRSDRSHHDEVLAGVSFLLECQNQLIMAGLALLRGHLSESFRISRRAIEACGFAYRIRQRSDLLSLWVRARLSEEDEKKYRKEFSTKKLFPKSHVAVTSLYERYDLLSKQVHTRMASLVRRLAVETNGSGGHLTMSYFEVSPDDPGEPARTLLWTVNTHLLILQVFEEILEEIIADDRSRWERQKNVVEAKLGAHHERWKFKLEQSDTDENVVSR